MDEGFASGHTLLMLQGVDLVPMEMSPRVLRFKPKEHAVGELPEGFEPVNPEVYWQKRNLYLNHIARKDARQAQLELIKKRRDESRQQQ